MKPFNNKRRVWFVSIALAFVTLLLLTTPALALDTTPTDDNEEGGAVTVAVKKSGTVEGPHPEDLFRSGDSIGTERWILSRLMVHEGSFTGKLDVQLLSSGNVELYLRTEHSPKWYTVDLHVIRIPKLGGINWLYTDSTRNGSLSEIGELHFIADAGYSGTLNRSVYGGNQSANYSDDSNQSVSGAGVRSAHPSNATEGWKKIRPDLNATLLDSRHNRSMELNLNLVLKGGLGEFPVTLSKGDGEQIDLVFDTVRNTPSEPVINYSPSEPVKGDTIFLHGLNSSDPDGEVERYFWSVNGENMSGSRINLSEIDAGIHNLSLTVEDDRGSRESVTTRIQVDNPAEIRVLNTTVSRVSQPPYKNVTIKVAVRNVGDVTGNYTIKLEERGREKDVARGVLDPGETKIVVFDYIFLDTGLTQINLKVGVGSTTSKLTDRVRKFFNLSKKDGKKKVDEKDTGQRNQTSEPQNETRNESSS